MKPEAPLDELARLNALAESAGGPARIARQKQGGRLTARERVIALLDEGSFDESDKLVLPRADASTSVHGDGVVAGCGRIDGRGVAVFAQDFTVHGGSLSEANAAKICRLMDKALRCRLPLIGLKDSVGGRILEGMGPMAGYGEVFHRNFLLSGVVPQISAIMGPCAGGAAYSPALTDFVFMVRDASYMFITGPDVIKTVMHETITKEELGGSSTHAVRTGTCHFVSDDDHAALLEIRRLLGYLPSSNTDDPPRIAGTHAPEYAFTDSLLPAKPAATYDVENVIVALVDRGSWMEVHAEFAENIVVGFARVGGDVVGVVANQPGVLGGCLDVSASRKAARFVRFCDCFNIPILTLVDTPGFLPGTQQETAGIITNGAKLLFAYSEATVPKITVILRKAYGGAYDVMGSRHLGADVVLATPLAELAVMGAEAAVNLLHRSALAAEADPEPMRGRLVSEYRTQYCHPYVAAARGIVDEVVRCEALRDKVCRWLWVLRNKVATHAPRKHGNIPL